jgi:hypothetical protein
MILYADRQYSRGHYMEPLDTQLDVAERELLNQQSTLDLSEEEYPLLCFVPKE